MKPTSASTVAASVIAGGVALWALQRVVIAAGYPAIIPSWTWGPVLSLLGVITVMLAWPIRRRVVAPGSVGPVDPVYATRVVLLAKSGVVAGAAFLGMAGGLGVVFVSRPIVVGGALWLTLFAAVGAIVLTAGGVVAERWCTLPPNSAEKNTRDAPQGDPA